MKTPVALWLLIGFLFPLLAHADPMRFADTSRGRPFSKDPSVIFFHGKYLLYYSLGPWTGAAQPPPNVPNTWAIGIATSNDLTTWTKAGEILPAALGEKQGFGAPGAQVLNGRVHLFYATYGDGPPSVICHATSEDGITFTRDASNPIFSPSGVWTNGRAIDPEVIACGDRLMLYFATRDPAGQIQKLGAASAPLASDYSRGQWRQEGTDSILAPELGWEKTCIEAPSVVPHGDKLFMFYAGAYNNAPQQIGVAVSTDGLKWQRVSQEPFLRSGAPGSWNESESGHPGIFLDPQSGRTYLFFQGNNDQGKTWYLSKVEVLWRDGLPQIGSNQ
ncbi:MAG: family 43 glycosylhydrolase [Chthoniobacter sp.]|nr:family 43 glycosylhydrolase [Chthoniobacter sp.]